MEPASFGKDKVPSPDQKYCQISATPTHRERKRRSTGSIPPPTAWKTKPHWLIADWLGFVEPVPPGEYKVTSPHQNSFQTYTTPTHRRRKRVIPESIPPSTVWKAQSHWLIADWLGSWSQRHPGEMENDRVPYPDEKSFHAPATPTHRGRKRRSPGSIPPRTVWKTEPRRLIAD